MISKPKQELLNMISEDNKSISVEDKHTESVDSSKHFTIKVPFGIYLLMGGLLLIIAGCFLFISGFQKNKEKHIIKHFGMVGVSIKDKEIDKYIDEVKNDPYVNIVKFEKGDSWNMKNGDITLQMYHPNINLIEKNEVDSYLRNLLITDLILIHREYSDEESLEQAKIADRLGLYSGKNLSLYQDYLDKLEKHQYVARVYCLFGIIFVVAGMILFVFSFVYLAKHRQLPLS
jgi:drug/metabolite transporter superfamily protein YnfA